MVLGLMTSPIRMIFSLLLMQGISLTMFRAFLNQAIQRVDPLKFQFNLGNSNFSSSTQPQTTTSLPQSSLPLSWITTLLSQQQNQQVTTPAPLVDQRVLDLVQLIRAIQPPLSLSSSPATSTVQVVPQPVMSSPIIALNQPPTTTPPSPVVQLPLPTTATGLGVNYPRIIMLLTPPATPQYSSSVIMKTSASDHIEKRMDTLYINELTTNKPPKNDLNPEVESSPEKTTPKRSKKKSKKKIKSAAGQKKNKSSKTAENNNLVVFEAVGWQYDGQSGGDDEN